MSDQLVNKWNQARRARKDAESWQALPEGPSYRQGGTFSISEAHSKAPMLTRCGQQSCGGNNYWETDKEFNAAILHYLVSNWDAIYPGVQEILQRREAEALIACQEYVSEMQSAIDAAKEGGMSHE